MPILAETHNGKACTKCGDFKPFSAFSVCRSKRSGYQSACKCCRAALYRTDKEAIQKYEREYRAANKERLAAQKKIYYARTKDRHQLRSRSWHLLRTYGISSSDFEAQLRQQGDKCAICHNEETSTKSGRLRPLSVDHDHATGVRRGLLCHRCNVVLGLLQDDPALAIKSAHYLSHWKEQTHDHRRVS